MDVEVAFSSLSEVLINSAKGEKGVTFIESEKDEDFLSYRELYHKAAYLLFNLQESGLKPGHELVFQFQNNKNLVITFWACILGKVIPVPITFGISDEVILKLANVWKLLNHPFLITDFTGFKDTIDSSEVYIDGSDIFANIRGRTIYFDDVNVIYKKAGPIPAELDDIAFIQYSSGSTGNPKGVINTHKSIIYNIHFMTKFFNMNNNEKILSWIPLTHDMGLIFFHILPLLNGIQQYLIPPIVFLTYPALWMTKASDHNITISGSPNFGYKYYLDHFDETTMYNRSLECLKFIINSAEPISFDVCEEFVRKLSPYKLNGKTIRPSYGLAEATLGVSSVPITDEFSQHFVHRDYLNVGDYVKFVHAHDENAVSFVDLGIFPFTSVIITDDVGDQLPERTIGHIKLKGPCVTEGYYNDPVTTNKVVDKDGWLNTGDLGFIHHQRLVIVGRAKEIIIINGQNYYPLDLERVAETLEGIEPGKIAITGVYNSKMHSEEVLSFVVFRQDTRGLKEFVPLATKLKLHFIDKLGIEVHQIIPVEKIPVTTSGKIQRYKLNERYLNDEFAEVIRELNSLHRQKKSIKRNLSKNEVQEIVVNICKDVLKRDEIGTYDKFFDLGGTSLYALRVRARIEEALGKNIADIALFKYPTIKALTDYLSTGNGEPDLELTAQPKEQLAAFIHERRVVRQRIKRNLTINANPEEGRNGWEIAVIGMSGRFPGAKNLYEFWDNLKNGVESISFFSHKELSESGVEPQMLKNPNYVKARGVLEDINRFDADFFEYTPLETEKMDPQVRLFHECLWEALEDAGCDPAAFKGLIGVYAGASPNHSWDTKYILAGRTSASEQFTEIPSNDKDFMSTRVSYKLNMKGPSLTVYTACSTSLVAVDLACRGLLTGNCDMALAGGVSIWMPYKTGYLYEENMLFSRDGHNRTFDARASGTVFSDGAGIVVLKRLEDSIRDRDHIYAVIKGSAVNNDGDCKVGYTAPGVEGQAEVIALAQQMAGVEPGSIGYLEAHGTATPLGDPIEIDALKLVFNTPEKSCCAIGSVKSNIGHLNAAAGVAGLIKTVLALKHRLIPPTINFKNPNPRIDFDHSPFYINTQLKKWEKNKYPRRAGISSFGIGGTNAHVILEEAPGIEKSSKGREWKIIMLSAKTESSLDKATANLLEYLKENPGVNLWDVAYTLQVGRRTFKYSRMLISSCVEAAVDALTYPGKPSPVDSGKVYTAVTEKKERPVIFMFPGVGSQYVDMGVELYQKELLFCREMDRCLEILKPLVDFDIKEILYPGLYPPAASGPPVSKRELQGVEIVHPVIFIFEYALAKLLMKWGVKPRVMIGYSLGEYVAACIAGVFSLEDALKLVVVRSRLIRETPQGAMLSIPLTVEEVKPLLENDSGLSIAVDNGPSTIVAGAKEEIDPFEEKMKKRKYMCMRVDNSRALHSKVMDPILKPFEKQVAQVTLREPRIPYISNVTGREIIGDDVTRTGYWVRHLRETVQFARGIEELVKEPNAIFVEVGSGRDLSVLVGRCIHSDSNQKVVNLVKPLQKNVSDVYYLLSKLGWLWIYGITPDWEGFYTGEKRLRIPLPTYPFEGECYDVSGVSPGAVTNALPGISPLTGIKDFKDWYYVPSWKRSRLPNKKMEESPFRSCWLLFLDDEGPAAGLAQQLTDRLTKKEQHVITVRTGETFSRLNHHSFIINPCASGDYEALFKELHDGNRIPGKIIHLWNITANNRNSSRSESPHGWDYIDRTVNLGFHSLVFLAKAIGNRQIEQDIQIFIITNNMQEVVGGDGVYPEKAVVLGPTRIIPREYPKIRCRSIDIVLQGPGNEDEYGQPGAIIRQLSDEFDSPSPHGVIAYRGNYRWRQVFDPYPLDNPREAAPRLKKKGVYLITGGLGGIGLILAEYLAKKVNAKLVLTGRSAFPPRDQWEKQLETGNRDKSINSKIRKLLEMEKLGSEILVLGADVTDQKQMQQVFARAEAQLGPINGVIHAACLPDGKKIQFRTGEESERILAAKIKGTLVIDRILKDKKPDFFILCSSLAAILAQIGQVGYCSANAFLDAYALYKSLTADMLTVSINWDRWKHVGIATIFENRYRDLTGDELTGGIDAEDGIEAFKCILSGAVPQIIVSPYDVNALSEQLNTPASSESALLEIIEEKIHTRARHRRPELDTEYIAPREKTEHILSEIWAAFLGFEKVGIQDDFFELGGDSLKAIAIAANINKKLNTKVPISVFFSRLTIKGTAEYLIEAKTSYNVIEPVEKKEYYSTTIGQKKLFVLNEMENIGVALNIFRILIIEGKLDKQRFEESFRALIKRQEIFRTSFHTIDGEIVMKIHETGDFAVEYVQLPESENQENELQEILSNFSTHFELPQPPLMKLKLVKLEKDKHMMLLDIHHIIMDDASRRVLFKEFSALYQGEELPVLRMAYKDYAQWQQKFTGYQEFKKLENYWLKRFSGNIPLLDLPTDFTRPGIQAFAGEWIRFSLEEELIRGIKRLAEESRATLYMIFLAAANILLGRYTSQEDITIASPVIGRDHEELENIIGLFINLLPMRNFPSPHKTFAHFLSEVKENALAAYENQAYPFGNLVEKLGLQKDYSRNPLNDVELIMVNPHVSLVEIEGLRFIPYEYDMNTTMVDIILEVMELGEKVSFKLMYCTKLFKRAIMERFINSFKEILEYVVEDKNILLEDIVINTQLSESKPVFKYNEGDFNFQEIKKRKERMHHV